MAVIAAVASMAPVGEPPTTPTEALPLQGAADGLVLSHQPAALFPSAYLPPWVNDDEVRQPAPNDDNHPGVTIEPTPTPTPTPTIVEQATARAASAGGSLSEAEMRAVLAEAGWPAELHGQALAVSRCESGYSPYANGDYNNHPEAPGYMSRGLFQMGVAGWRWVNGAWTWWNGWFVYFGYSDADAYDPLVNARTALYAYQRSGWGPWSCRSVL